MIERSSRPEVRNPVLGLPSARLLLDQPPEVRAALRAVLLDLKAQAVEKERAAYAKRKGPMTAYWMAAGTYFKHIAGVLK